MKKIRYIIASALVSIGLCACTDTWDSHYSKWETVIDNTEIQAVDEPAADFLKTAQDYSKMNELFDKTGVIKTWQEKNLMYTIMVVGNESTAMPTNLLQKQKVAKDKQPLKRYLRRKHTLLMLFFHPVIWKMDSVC